MKRAHIRRKTAVVSLCRMGLTLDPRTRRASSLILHWWANTPEGRERLCDGLGEADGVSFGIPPELQDEPTPHCQACVSISVASMLRHDQGKSAIIFGLDTDFEPDNYP